MVASVILQAIPTRLHRMVLEALGTRVSVAPDGALKVSFSIPAHPQPDVTGSIVSVPPGADEHNRPLVFELA